MKGNVYSNFCVPVLLASIQEYASAGSGNLCLQCAQKYRVSQNYVNTNGLFFSCR